MDDVLSGAALGDHWFLQMSRAQAPSQHVLPQLALRSVPLAELQEPCCTTCICLSVVWYAEIWQHNRTAVGSNGGCVRAGSQRQRHGCASGICCRSAESVTSGRQSCCRVAGTAAAGGSGAAASVRRMPVRALLLAAAARTALMFGRCKTDMGVQRLMPALQRRSTHAVVDMMQRQRRFQSRVAHALYNSRALFHSARALQVEPRVCSRAEFFVR